MTEYPVIDTAGRVVVLQEKTSILLTIGMVLAAIGVIGIFGMAVFVAARSIEVAAVLAFQGLISLIYVFILNHLRKKGDMNVSYAVFPTAYGGAIEVRKKSSIWITIALVFAVIGIIGSIGLIGFGVYVMSASEEAGASIAAAGVIGVIVGALYAAILNFLRTKIDFPGDRVVLRTTTGFFIELYKSTSIWLTIGMVLTLLGAIALLALGAVIMISGPEIMGEPMGFSYGYAASLGPDLRYSGASLILLGLILLINVAVLNFLRVRGHVRPAQGGYVPTQPMPTQQPYYPGQPPR